MVRKSLLFTDNAAAFKRKNALDDVSMPVFRPVAVLVRRLWLGLISKNRPESGSRYLQKMGLLIDS